MTKNISKSGVLVAIIIFLTLAFLLQLKLKPLIKTTLPPVKPYLGNSNKVDHIAILVMENKAYQTIIGNSQAPYLTSLSKKYASAENYYATTHPSLPNYLAILGGSTFNITSDCTNCFIDSRNLVDLLEENKKSWKAYMDSMPSSCFSGNSGNYAQKHNPFIYFNNIKNSKDRCKNIVPFGELTKDLENPQTTPNFIWITPDMCHDMHDCSIKVGDDWLSKEIPQILNSPAFSLGNSLLIITWDESELLGSNQIPTILIGKPIKENFVSNIRYDHYSLLHTIEHLWGLPTLTENDKQAPIMSDFF